MGKSRSFYFEAWDLSKCHLYFRVKRFVALTPSIKHYSRAHIFFMFYYRNSTAENDSDICGISKRLERKVGQINKPVRDEKANS